jgi:hypothetical protein
MHRAALPVGAFFSVLTVCARVFAHGVPPDAYSVLAQDAQGPRAVSLSAGVALRRSAMRFQYVCPAAWGDQFAAPLAALADGTIVVGATSGLMLLSDDGTLRAHPDPAAVGRSSDVVRSARGVFSLRSTPSGSEVLGIDAEHVRVLWKSTNSLYSLAALDDKLVLLRTTGRVLEQVMIATADGAELERQTAVLDSPADSVFARTNAGTAYAVVDLYHGPVMLGTVGMNAFTSLAQGELAIVGPLTVDSSTLLALDGKLAQLVDGHALPLVDDHNVVCLAEHDGLTYACDTDGIARLSDQTLGEPLFLFSWLSAPNLEQVPVGDARMLCNMQWQDLRFDVQLTGASLLEDAMPDAGTALVDAGMAAAGVDAALATGRVDAKDAGGAAAAVPAQMTRQGATSCGMLPGTTVPRATAAGAFGLVLAFALESRRRARLRRMRRGVAKP